MCVVALLTGALAPVLTDSVGAGRSAGAAPPEGTVTLWGDAPTAVPVASDDPRPVELGTAFTPEVDGTAVGVRFWKSSGNDGTHIGHLWGPDGAQLATTTFSSESASGWQNAVFEAPVPLTAGTRYVVSYYAPRGRYVISQNFTEPTTAAGLSVERGRSGVFAYGSTSRYPASSWRSSQYWVDVLFEPSAAARPTPAHRATPSPRTTTPSATPSTSPSPSPSPSPSASPSPSPSPSPTIEQEPEPTPEPAAAPTPATPAAPAPDGAGRFPTAATTGVPPGWQPRQSHTGDLVVDTPGAVVEDLRLTNGTLHVRAPNVTLRRVEISGGQINNYWSGTCYGGLRIEDTTIVRGSTDIGQPVIQYGGYTAVRVKIDGTSEGLRVGAGDSGCGATLVQDSWVHVTPYDDCVANNIDWHGDGLQGYQGADVTIRNSYIGLESVPGCVGNAAIFWPDQGNSRITLDHVLAAGGGFTVRIETPGTVTGLKVVDDAWTFEPKRIACDLVEWGSGNAYVRLALDGSTTDVAPLPCDGW